MQKLRSLSHLYMKSLARALGKTKADHVEERGEVGRKKQIKLCTRNRRGLEYLSMTLELAHCSEVLGPPLDSFNGMDYKKIIFSKPCPCWRF
ncbi:hypothetical protein VTL71DRAFT_14508 [Oculimacula yallundae]|uniref:Uncharacterized protein n=1 Tax=Oculimacula yallundae TaxID=86028 RepID=A0ABR4CKZ3_9HELO